MLSRNDEPPDIWNTHGISGNVFVNPPASSSSLYPGGFNPWTSNVTEDTSPHVSSERQNPDTTLDPRCQSGPSARNSFDPKKGRFSKDYGADQQRLQISELHFDKFPTPTTFACWKIRFKTEISTRSQFPTEGMLWIKEVEMVDSVDDLKSSRSIQRNKQNHPEYPLQEKGQSGGNESSQRRPFPSWKTDRLPDLRVLRGHWGQRFCRELCRPITVALRNDDIQEFDSKWDEILLSVTQIPSDDILESLY